MEHTEPHETEDVAFITESIMADPNEQQEAPSQASETHETVEENTTVEEETEDVETIQTSQPTPTPPSEPQYEIAKGDVGAQFITESLAPEESVTTEPQEEETEDVEDEIRQKADDVKYIEEAEPEEPEEEMTVEEVEPEEETVEEGDLECEECGHIPANSTPLREGDTCPDCFESWLVTR